MCDIVHISTKNLIFKELKLKKLLYKVKGNNEVFTGTIVNIEGSSKEEREIFEKNYLDNLCKKKGKIFVLRNKD